MTFIQIISHWKSILNSHHPWISYCIVEFCKTEFLCKISSGPEIYKKSLSTISSLLQRKSDDYIMVNSVGSE